MKRTFIYTLLSVSLIACSIALKSCSEPEDNSRPPFFIHLSIQDSSSNNLLDEDVEGSLFGTSISIVRDGVEYNVDWSTTSMNEFGLYYIPDENPTLWLGTFWPYSSYSITMELKWDSGRRTDTIRVMRRDDHTYFYLNGEECSSEIILIK